MARKKVADEPSSPTRKPAKVSAKTSTKAPAKNGSAVVKSGRQPLAGGAAPGAKSAKPGGKRGRSAQIEGSADTAARIQDVALDLFARSSFSAVTIKEIGEATGLNTAMIYYYFRDKEDLFRSTVEIAVKQSLAAFANRPRVQDPAAVISDWLDIHIEQLELIRKFVKISLDYANSGKRIARIDKAIRDFYDQEKAILAAAIDRGIASGQFHERNTGLLIDFISTYLDGIMIRSFTFSEFNAASAIRRFRIFLLEQLKRRPPQFEE
jgi:TetR/AcrR family transcriptional regulator, upper aerobic nicotinate degradation pathway regulator